MSYRAQRAASQVKLLCFTHQTHPSSSQEDFDTTFTRVALSVQPRASHTNTKGYLVHLYHTKQSVNIQRNPVWPVRHILFHPINTSTHIQKLHPRGAHTHMPNRTRWTNCPALILWISSFASLPPFLHHSLLPCTRKHRLIRLSGQLDVLWSSQLLWPISRPSLSLCRKSSSYSSPLFLLPSLSPNLTYFLVLKRTSQCALFSMLSFLGCLSYVPSRRLLLLSFLPFIQRNEREGGKCDL